MTGNPWRRRVRAVLFVAALVAITAFFAWPRPPAVPPPREVADRPALMLMTSLPLLFGETFSLEGNGSPAIRALEQRYRIVPIGVADRASLGDGGLLLMAHANAQPAQALVDLDNWVRGGGRLLLLADPQLEWPSTRPLGDRLRPSPMFTDNGLLAHWGLKLDRPAERGQAVRKLGGRDIRTASPGRLSGDCAISSDGLVARCDIGKGRAVVVADADFLDVDDLGSPAAHNLDALLAELGTLEQWPPADSDTR
jgi:hypothetical protein